MQWKHEVLSHTDGLQVLVWHGASRETSHKELAKYDMVRVEVTGSVDGTSYNTTGVDDLLGLRKVNYVVYAIAISISISLVASASKKAVSSAKASSLKRNHPCIKLSGTEF